MRPLSATLCLTTLSFAALIGGCNSGSDGGGSSGNLSSGVSKDKPASDVTNAEAEAVCEAVQDYAEAKINTRSFKISVCRWAAVSTVAAFAAEDTGNVDLGDLCDVAYDACVDCVDHPGTDGCEDLDMAFAEFEFDEPCTDSEPPPDCDATVGEVEACFQAQVDGLAGIFGDVPACSQVDADTAGDLEEDPFAALDTPAACEDIADSCPAVLE